MVDGLNDHRIADIGEFFAEGFRWMGNAGCGTKNNLKEFQDNWQKPFQVLFVLSLKVFFSKTCKSLLWSTWSTITILQAAFSDKVCVDEARLYMGEWAAAFGRQEAIHSGEFMGIAPTGKRVQIRYMDFWKVVDKKIVDNYVSVDFPHVMAQLGKDAFDGNGWEVYDRGERVPPAPNNEN